jgi:hypothetical protein
MCVYLHLATYEAEPLYSKILDSFEINFYGEIGGGFS